MSINPKRLGALLCVVAVGVAVASTAGAARQGTPGVTAKKVVIGGTFPLTGGASLYATITVAEQAYFAAVNAHGGVNGRKIQDIVYDDQYDPSQTVPAVKKLVEQNHVFAIVGSLGTAPGLATMNYLNNKKVPQVLLATGDAYWGYCAKPLHHGFKPIPGVCSKPKPWTMGWQPDYPGEAMLYGQYIVHHKPAAKIGVLYQNDAYGKNYLAGFKKGLASHKKQIVSAQSYNFGDSAQVVGAHIGALYAAGADTVAIFATPTASIQSLATMGAVLHWHPLTFLNNVSANRLFLLAAEGNGATPNGVISSGYVGSQTVTPSAPGMKQARSIIKRYAHPYLADFDAGDQNLVYGLGVAYTFVDALTHAGKNLTRNSFMNALRNLKETKNPFVYPGITVATSAQRTWPMQQLVLQKWLGTKHDWKPISKVLTSGY